MRNNDTGGKSNIHFVYGFESSDNIVAVNDTNTWANLGQMHELTFSGGGEGKATRSAGTEPVNYYSLYPSTNTFLVPEEAEGANTLTLTRNECECMLYITDIKMTRNPASSVQRLSSSTTAAPSAAYNLAGQKACATDRGFIIKDGKLIIRK